MQIILYVVLIFQMSSVLSQVSYRNHDHADVVIISNFSKKNYDVMCSYFIFSSNTNCFQFCQIPFLTYDNRLSYIDLTEIQN